LAELKEIVGNLLEHDKHTREKLRVIQAACESGWKMAKIVSAVQEGSIIIGFKSS